jgi:hypothetical protein
LISTKLKPNVLASSLMEIMKARFAGQAKMNKDDLSHDE